MKRPKSEGILYSVDDYTITLKKEIEQLKEEIKSLQFKLRPTYVTIEGRPDDIAKDLKQYIIWFDELKQINEIQQKEIESLMITLEAERGQINGK